MAQSLTDAIDELLAKIRYKGIVSEVDANGRTQKPSDERGSPFHSIGDNTVFQDLLDNRFQTRGGEARRNGSHSSDTDRYERLRPQMDVRLLVLVKHMLIP